MSDIVLRRLTVHDVETGRSPEYPDLQPMSLAMAREAAFRIAVAVARGMPRWTIVEVSARDGRLRAEARTRLLRFTDDVTIRVEPGSDGGSLVHVRSASRVGVYDFGTNARRIRSYLGCLRERLAIGRDESSG